MALRLAGLSVALICAVAQAWQDGPRAPAQDVKHDGRGALAVLRRDGLMFPFASFDRDSWSVPWPVNEKNLEVPATLDAVPRRWWGRGQPEAWRAYVGSGAPVPVDVLKPVLKHVFCSPRVWLATAYQSTLEMPPSPIDPFPKDGLVVNGDVPIEAIETVDRSSPEWGAFAVNLMKEFDRIEDRTIGGVRSNAGWRHPVAAAERHRTRIALESWYRAPLGDPGWMVSYIEAVRAYAPGPEDKGCGLETLVSGFVFHKDGVLRKDARLAGKITYCDRVGATYMLPFGRIRPKEKTYWVFQMSGWEAEWYDVVEVGRDRARYIVEVPAGRARCF